MSVVGLTAANVGAEGAKKALSNVSVTTAPVHVGNSNYKESVLEESVNVTIGLFFDGTLNNANNTNARIAYKKAGSQSGSELAKTYKRVISNVEKDLRGSYENDLSNVARMEPAYLMTSDAKHLQTRIYIEGIGTTDNQADDKDGMGTGDGETGMPKKAEKACEKIAKICKKAVQPSTVKNIKLLRIDVFGFSRGAAAARHFIHEIHRSVYRNVPAGRRSRRILISNRGKLGKKFKDEGIDEPLAIEVRFAGLYETVASYGLEHNWDTSQLGLDAVKRAKQTFQLVAQDEHRENFVITNIDSTGSRGVQKLIPGVHSDIGGGYTNDAKEENLVLMEGSGAFWQEKKANKMRNQLIEEGWYKADEIFVTKDKINLLKNNAVVINRKVDSNKYSFVPLHIMVEYSEKKDVPFLTGIVTDSYTLTETTNLVTTATQNVVYTTDLQAIKERLNKHVYKDAPAMQLTAPDDENMLRVIRGRYVHSSAHYNDKIKIAGILYAPHHPRDSYLTREREENDG